MQKLIDTFKAQIDDFIEQRSDFLMLLGCSQLEAPIALKIIQDIEQQNNTDVFLLFADDFIALQPYVDVAIERLREQYQLANAWLAEQGHAALPAMPTTLDDPHRPPLRRLAEAMQYARALVPREGGHRLVWAMLPQHIHDPEAWHAMVNAFAPHQGIRPGMQGIRLLFRAAPDCESAYPVLFAAPRVRMNTLDLSQDKLEDSLAQDAEDESKPADQRMQALLKLALFDAAYNRKIPALSKFKILLGYYQGSTDYKMQAFTMNSIGDVYKRNDQLDRAQYWYECALPPIIEAKDPVIFHTIVRNLGDVAYAQQDYPLAEQHYSYADQLADKMLDPEGKIRDLEARGLSQEQQGAYDRALASWELAAQLARHIEQAPLLHIMLDHLERGYRKTTNFAKAAAVKTEQQQLQASEVRS